MSKHILVVGGAGYIGSHTAKLLAKKGYTPVVLDDLSTGHEWAVQFGPFIKGSYADVELVQKTVKQYKIDTIFHFGAKALVEESVENPLLYHMANVGNTLQLLNAVLSARDPIYFIFSSTCATFGVPARTPIDETLPQNPINPYGSSKLMVEMILRDLAKRYPFYQATLRYFNAAGSDSENKLGEEHEPETHLIPRLIRALESEGNTPLTVHGSDYPTPDGSCVRDYIHVEDLAEAHVLAMEYLEKEKKSLDLNLGSEKGYSVFEVIKAAEGATGKKVHFSVGPRRVGDPPVLVANSGKAKQQIKWQAKRDLNEILQSSYNWFKKSRASK